MRCQAADIGSVEVRSPQIVRVRERDAVLADGGIRQKACVIDIDREGRNRTEGNRDRTEDSFHFSLRIGQWAGSLTIVFDPRKGGFLIWVCAKKRGRSRISILTISPNSNSIR